MGLLPLEVAQALLLDSVEPLGAETLPVQRAVGRYLAAPILARRTQPAADLSAMDGYAMGEDDLDGPWSVIGESAAGHPFAGTAHKGEAVRVSTGALLPDGTGAVLLQENAERSGDKLALSGPGAPAARHIRRKGFDFSACERVLDAGSAFGPAQLALALAAGVSEAAIHRQPTLAILDSGDELAADPAACAAHQIPASNGAMLAAMAAPLAGEVRRLGPLPDRMDALLGALEQARQADVIVTSGGASVGDHDLVRPTLEQWGATIDFWKVAIKPGKPLLVARRDRTIVLGLPGNPVSSYVTAFLFLLPLLRRLAGASATLPRPLMLSLEGELPAAGDRLEFVRATLARGRAVPIRQQDSSALAALSAADLLIRREVGAGPARPGDTLAAYLLQNGGIA